MERLATRVIDLAFVSLTSRSQPIQIVQALLLLCSWPVPVETKGKDISHILGGAAMQLAMQNGLHIFSDGQEFSRTMLRSGSNDKAHDVTVRARLWACCVIVCQRYIPLSTSPSPRVSVPTDFCSVSLSDGLSPSMVLDSFNFDVSQTQMWTALLPDLLLRLKLHIIQIDAVVAFVRNGLTLTSPVDGSNMLNTLIELYDQRAQDLISAPLNNSGEILLYHVHHRLQLRLSQPDKLFFDSTRLNIRVFHFFGTSDPIYWAAFHKLYGAACAVIEDLVQLDDTHDYCLYAPHCAVWTIPVAAFSILRLLRSNLGQQLDSRRGEQAYFAAIHIYRKRSVQNDDLYARGGVIMTQLWSSDTIFRRKDGRSDSLRLRTRSRLVRIVLI